MAKKITIDREKCKGCLLCVSFCPNGSIVEDKELNKHGLRPVKLKELAECSGCAMCAVICPDCCIEVHK